jgi:putative tricarboxylic transport membrane protein
MSAILGGQVSVGINGLAEFLPQIGAGAVRVLALSSAERLANLDAPTLREQGIDIEFENWRSIVAPPDMSASDLERIKRTIDAMVRSEPWRAALTRYRWIDRYLAGDDFARFTEAEDMRVRSVLDKLGIGPSSSEPRLTARVYPTFVLAGVVLFGMAALVAALTSRRTTAEASRPIEWRPAALLAVGVLLDLAFLERAGFVITSALLFWLTARAFDHRHPLRDAVFAAAVATGSYLLFVRVLNVSLPAGLLARWL